MGCHTAAAWALENPGRVAALILIGPVYTGQGAGEDEGRWDERAKALADGGPEAFAAVVSTGFEDPEIAATVRRLALERARLHRDPVAVAEALRQVPRSRPFGTLDDLGSIQAPTLIVGTRDDTDPGHPLSVAEAWRSAIPGAVLVVEDEGDSPLSWQGGRLSRIIAGFLEQSLGSSAGPTPETGMAG